METDLIPQRHGRYLLEEMGSESLVYRRPAKQGVYLNETATAIWKLCDGTRTMQQIADVLAENYPDAAEAVRADVIDAIDGLVRSGALKLVGPREASIDGTAG